MILVGVAAELSVGLPLRRVLPELELGFGGPVAGAGVLGPSFALPVHYLHGAVLGLLFVGIILLGERYQLTPQLSLPVSGLVFGAAVSVAVLLLLWWTSPGPLSLGLIGLVCLLHLTFGGLAGTALEYVRAPSRSAPVGAPSE
jgi:hypothetical protein